MRIRHMAGVLTFCALVGSVQAGAQEPLATYKSLAPGIALELAQAALMDCQKRGYQVAIAVVDRFGVVQVVLRDRFAGPHTPRPPQERPGRRRPFATVRAAFSRSVSPA